MTTLKYTSPSIELPFALHSSTANNENFTDVLEASLSSALDYVNGHNTKEIFSYSRRPLSYTTEFKNLSFYNHFIEDDGTTSTMFLVPLNPTIEKEIEESNSVRNFLLHQFENDNLYFLTTDYTTEGITSSSIRLITTESEVNYGLPFLDFPFWLKS